MVEIQSKEVIDKISDELKIQPSLLIPRQLMDKIQLTYNVNPKRLVILRSIQRTSTGNTALFTTPTNQDFFLTGMTLQNQSDVVADNILINISGTLFGQASSQTLLLLSKLTLTVFEDSLSIVLTPPLLLSRGSIITAGSIFAVGASITGASITGFLTDPQ